MDFLQDRGVKSSLDFSFPDAIMKAKREKMTLEEAIAHCQTPTAKAVSLQDGEAIPRLAF